MFEYGKDSNLLIYDNRILLLM